MKAIVDDKIPYIRGQVERLVDEVVYLPGASITPADARDADILIIRTRTRCDSRLLSGSRVRLVVTATIGHDHIDADYMARAGIEWASCPGCNATSVGQYVRAALLAWAGRRAADLTVGIVGVGNVGTAVAAALRPLGCRLLLCDPPKGMPATLEDIQRQADVVTLHVPLQADTRHMVDRSFLDGCQRQPLIINAARGGVAHDEALLWALEQHKISQAVIDCWENEPDINLELLRKAFIATPHIAGYSADGKANATSMALHALARWLGSDTSITIALPPACPDAPEYDPRTDSQRLKADPKGFEWQRGNYPMRRETAHTHVF